MFRSCSIRALAFWLAALAGLQAQQYVFRAYRQSEGLKNVSIHGLTTDREGFLWLSTENGLYRFLGAGFERFGPEQGIAGLDIRDIVADPEGTVWVGTDENLYRWDGVRFLPAGREPIPIADARRMALEDSRHLLVVEKGRLYRLEHGADGRMISYLPVLPGSLVSSIPDLGRIVSVSVLREPLNGRRIWIGCGKKLYSLSSGPIEPSLQIGQSQVTEWSKPQGLAPDSWENVTLDRGGTLWAAGLKHVMVLPPGARRFIDRSIPGADQQNIFGHAPLLEDPQGRMLAPAGVGIARWDGGRWRIIGRSNGLRRITAIVGMAFDGAGDLALASRGDALYEWAGYADWESWDDERSLPSPSIWAIVLGNANQVFVGTDHGPAWLDPGKGTAGPMSAHAGWDLGRVSAMGANRDGSLWASTHSGAIVRIDPNNGRTETIAKLPAQILASFQDATGDAWFFTDEGIYTREAGDARAAPHRMIAADALVGESTIVQSACQSPDGATWLVGNNRLVRFKDGQWSAPPIDGLPRLKGELLGNFCSRDGSIWVTGDQTGTWRLTPHNGRLQAGPLELPVELQSLACLTILEDRRGWIWLGTDLGLAVWNGHEWRHLTQESGLIWNDTNQGVLREASDGSLWIGTSVGLSHLLHPEHVFDPIPLSVSLTEIRRGNTDFVGAQQITLPEAGRPLWFVASSPSTRNRSELILKVRMVGMQSEWIETKDGTAAFARIGPGTYTFTAVACNPSFNICSDPVKVGVRILPPWWQTYWAYALASLLVAMLVFGSGRLYVRHLRQKSIELERLVGQRTYELELSREQLRIQATHDGLTGMLNREAIVRALMAEMERQRRKNSTLVVALADLDHFKRVNDARGHLAGDEALRRFAAAVGAAIRSYDHAGRYGGEEFLIVLTDIPPEDAEKRLAALHTSISKLQVRTSETVFAINCSIGAAVVGTSAGSVKMEFLLAVADQALYEAKATGRNRVVIKRLPAADSQHEDLIGRRASKV